MGKAGIDFEMIMAKGKPVAVPIFSIAKVIARQIANSINACLGR